jgi:hypothetical protein
MTVDVRAKVFCNLGPLISGNLSDELLTIGQGLIRCRGQLVLKGLFAPPIGSVVSFGYEKDGRVARLPRVLRVLGSFADPFRNTTTVSVGDKLVLLENKKSHVTPPATPLPTEAEIGQQEVDLEPYPSAPQIIKEWNGACWQELSTEESGFSEQFPLSSGFNYDSTTSSQTVTAAEQYGNIPVSDFAAVKPSLSAAFIALKCLGALGVPAVSLPLNNQYNEGEFDLSEGYVSVLEKLLSSEGLVGYLNSAEFLVVEPIDAVVSAGVIVSSDTVIDVSPLNFGTPPADEISVLISTTKNLEKNQPLENQPPYANDFNLGAGAKTAGQPFIVSYSTLEANGYDPDYFEQILFNTKTRLKVASVTAGSGCTLVAGTASATVTPAKLPSGETKGAASFSYTLTDGQTTSNTATCFFEVTQPAESELSPASIEQSLEAAKTEYQAVKDESQLPKKNTPDNETTAQETEARKRNWELDESIGIVKTVYINYTDPFDDEDVVADFDYVPYSQSSSFYDDLDRKVVSYSYQEGITAEVAGNIVKAILENGVSGSIGFEKVRWYTKEEFFYYTKYEKETEYNETLSEYGRAYEDNKEREKQAWQDAMEENRIANEGETGAILSANSITCPIDFNPPTSPESGDTYNYDGMVFRYSAVLGWQHEKGDFAPIASSFPGVIYTNELTDLTRTVRESVISYMTEQVARTYGPLREVFGGLPLPFNEEFYYMPSNTGVLTDKTVIRYDVDWLAGKSKTYTERWTIAANTAPGQQYIKKLCDELADAAPEDRASWLTAILNAATELVYLGVDTQIRTDRQYGVQQRPSIYDREWSEVIGDEKPDPEVFGEFNVVDRNATSPNNVVELEQFASTIDPSSLTERSTSLTLTPPYSTGPSRSLSFDANLQKIEALYEESKAQQQALIYGRAANAIARGNRYGMNLQLGIESVPTSPLAWMYLKVGNVAAGYRTNGVSYVFNDTGLLCSVDALFWGGVGGDGAPWFPLAQGITVMPALPSITTQTAVLANSITTPEDFDASDPGDVWDELPYTEEPVYAAEIEPTALLAAVNEAIRCVALVQVSIAVQSFSYPLEVLTEVEPLVVTAGVSAARVKLLLSETGAVTLSGQTAALVRRYRMVSAAGSFALNGFSAGSVRDYVIGTNSGTFTATGQAAMLEYERLPLIAEAGAINLTGADAILQFIQTRIAGEVGAFSITGQVAGLLRTLKLSAEAGTFSLNGQDATLIATLSQTEVLYYTGTASALSVTGAGFEPGFVALKRRAATANHGWYDHLRGTGVYIPGGQATAEQTLTTGLTSFDADGFSLDTSTVFNTSSATHVAWCLPKGGAAANNTDGTKTVLLSANSSVEYSLFTYTGDGSSSVTIGHGLSGTPDLVLIKSRALSTGHYVGSPSIGVDKHFVMSSTSATATSSTTSYKAFGSTTLTIGQTLNQNGPNYAGIALKAKAGTSNFSTFTGSGSATYTETLGYQPKMLIIKNITTTTSDWLFCYRPSGGTGYVTCVRLNTSGAEFTSTTVQITSTGFSVDVSGPGNVSGGTTEALYWAMA